MLANRPVTDERALEDVLSRPYPEDVRLAGRLEDDVLVLGAGGKTGPTLVLRIVRALSAAGSSRTVYAVSRFSDVDSRATIEASGAVALSADLLDEDALADLPACRNVIFLVGMKFGATGQEPHTWAVNTYLPGRVADRFRDSRIVALSTGNVYPYVPVDGGGASESVAPEPIGEYAQSCLGRERIFEHFSGHFGTPVCLLRLNYAVEARYGVLLDIATKVYRGDPLSVETGYFNAIWQGDANSVCFRALEACESPAAVLNVTGPDVLSVRALAHAFGERFGHPPRIVGEEAPTALLSDASRCHARFGTPRVAIDEVIDLVASWVERGGPTHEKPTMFDVRDGRF